MDVLSKIQDTDSVNPIEITVLHDLLINEKNIHMDVLRLDLIHPQVSGNKWFKLKYNILEAILQKAESILSFGGAYSNHLHALAYAGKLFNIKTIGMIRGDEVTNETLEDCKTWGMELHFIARSEYKNRYDVEFLKSIQKKFPNSLIVPEGGNNEAGLKGAKEILQGVDLNKYAHICCSVGTGTTFTGIVESSLPTQHVLGFVAIKNGQYLEAEIKQKAHRTNWQLFYDTHLGGYAKKTPELISFIQNFKALNHIELDFVYTGKMVKAIYEMTNENYFEAGSRILLIHTGGVQGNRGVI